MIRCLPKKTYTCSPKSLEAATMSCVFFVLIDMVLFVCLFVLCVVKQSACPPSYRHIYNTCMQIIKTVYPHLLVL